MAVMAGRVQAALRAVARGLTPLLAALRPAFGNGPDGKGTDCPLPAELLVSVVAAAAEGALVDACGAGDLTAAELDCLRRPAGGSVGDDGDDDDDDDDVVDSDTGGSDAGELVGSFIWRVAEQAVDDFAAAAAGERKSLAARKEDRQITKAVRSVYWKYPAADVGADDDDIEDGLKAFATRWVGCFGGGDGDGGDGGGGD